MPIISHDTTSTIVLETFPDEGANVEVVLTSQDHRTNVVVRLIRSADGGTLVTLIGNDTDGLDVTLNGNDLVPAGTILNESRANR